MKECARLVKPARRLLDVGCSSGWLAPLALAKGVHEYVGADRYFEGTPTESANVSFVVGSALDLPFPEASFDAVCLFDVIEHLPRNSELRALREARRVLGPGSHLYLSTPHASWIHAPLDPAWFLGHRHYCRSTLKQMIESAGFQVETMFVAGGLVECVDHLRLLFYKHLLHKQPPAIPLVARLIERSHGKDHRLGMTVFLVASPDAR